MYLGVGSIPISIPSTQPTMLPLAIILTAALFILICVSFINVQSISKYLLPTGSEEREVFGVGSIPAAILPSRQDIKTISL